MKFWIAQALAIVSGICILFGVRSKSKLAFLFLNLLSNFMGFLSMIILGAYAATVGPVVLILQSAITYLYDKENRKQPQSMLALYLVVNLLGGALTVRSTLGILPVISSTIASVMVAVKKMKHVRILNAVSSVIALPYLVSSRAYVSAAVFFALFVNALAAIWQYDFHSIEKENTIS